MGERSCLLLKVQSLVLKLKSTYVDGFALFLGLIVALGLVGRLVVGGGLVTVALLQGIAPATGGAML